MIIAHASVAIIANRLLNKNGYQNKKLSIVSDILAGLFGILPDFDFFYLLAFDGSTFNHHSLITHTPIFWLALFFILRFGFYFMANLLNKETSKAFNMEIRNIFTTTLLIGTLSHLIADLFTGQIMLLYPFNQYAFSLFGNLLPTNLFAGYSLHPIFGLELILIIISMYMMIREYFKTQNYRVVLKFFTGFLIATIAISYGFIYYITYHKEVFPLLPNGLSHYDHDDDGLIDTSDLDTNNDGKNNLQDVDYDLLVKDAYEIINSHKLAGYNRLALNIGGYDSSRIIFGAYAQQGKSAIPVLTNYLVTNKISLNDKKNYMAVLLDYLTYYKSITNRYTMDSLIHVPKGNIFFVLDRKDDKLVDEGMVLDNFELAITLPNEKVLKVHTIEDLKTAYSDTDYYIIVQE